MLLNNIVIYCLPLLFLLCFARSFNFDILKYNPGISDETDETLFVSFQLIEVQKELQKHILTTVANPVGKEGKKLEGFKLVHDLCFFICRLTFGEYLRIAN